MRSLSSQQSLGREQGFKRKLLKAGNRLNDKAYDEVFQAGWCTLVILALSKLWQVQSPHELYNETLLPSVFKSNNNNNKKPTTNKKLGEGENEKEEEGTGKG